MARLAGWRGGAVQQGGQGWKVGRLAAEREETKGGKVGRLAWVRRRMTAERDKFPGWGLQRMGCTGDGWLG